MLQAWALVLFQEGLHTHACQTLCVRRKGEQGLGVGKLWLQGDDLDHGELAKGWCEPDRGTWIWLLRGVPKVGSLMGRMTISLLLASTVLLRPESTVPTSCMLGLVGLAAGSGPSSRSSDMHAEAMLHGQATVAAPRQLAIVSTLWVTHRCITGATASLSQRQAELCSPAVGRHMPASRARVAWHGPPTSAVKLCELMEAGQRLEVVERLAHVVHIAHCMVHALNPIGDGCGVHVLVPSQVRPLHLRLAAAVSWGP